MKLTFKAILLSLIGLLCQIQVATANPIPARKQSNTTQSFAQTIPHHNHYHSINGITSIVGNVVTIQNITPAPNQNSESCKLPFGKASLYFKDIVAEARKSIGHKYLSFCRYIVIAFNKEDIIFPFHYFL